MWHIVRSVIQNAHGNVTIQSVMQSAIQFANHQNATLLAKSQRMQFAMSNVRNPIATLCAQTKHASSTIAQNVLQSVSHLTVSLTAKFSLYSHLRYQNQSVKLFATNQNVTGSALSHNAQNQNANWFVRIQIADQLMSVANVKQAPLLLEQEFQCSKKWNQINNAANARYFLPLFQH